MNARTFGTVVLIGALTSSGMATTGCTSKRLIAPQISPHLWPLKPGDHVEIRLRDRQTVRIVVDHADETGIVSRDKLTFQSTDITSVRRIGFSAGKTIGLAALGFLLFLAAAGAAAYMPYGGV